MEKDLGLKCIFELFINARQILRKIRIEYCHTSKSVLTWACVNNKVRALCQTIDFWCVKKGRKNFKTLKITILLSHTKICSNPDLREQQGSNAYPQTIEFWCVNKVRKNLLLLWRSHFI